MIKADFSLDDLLGVILSGRNNGYAGSKEKVQNPQRPGFKEFSPFVRGGWEYVDSYAGHYFSPWARSC